MNLYLQQTTERSTPLVSGWVSGGYANTVSKKAFNSLTTKKQTSKFSSANFQKNVKL